MLGLAIANPNINYRAYQGLSPLRGLPDRRENAAELPKGFLQREDVSSGC